ncbi:DUF2851 family protein [Ferruginibacter albus]|uniref:DUF2851 family protein n=1 Tax=Ferruginibacter albus TaxID=2875540 RepID=UPI001CC78D33|nr:DUF2851 family protein [Ferruginibacter albus]UAY50761.1 DUF2851 family protein [Ferruginibacter albus]
MNEALLQYIWQFQYFNKQELQTTEGEPISIIFPGLHNTNQGPDFTNAKIKINNTTWYGSVELHLRSSDWEDHDHAADKNYQNVILHVVWLHDKEVNISFPTVELQAIVPKILLNRYNDLMNDRSFIACENLVGNMDDIIWLSWKERLLIERLQKKSQLIFQYLDDSNNHWEETFWWLIARTFGAKVNSDAFEKIARSVSTNILAKHKHQIHQLEALLFGQAGLLETVHEEDYPILLQKEYHFLSNKYQLAPVKNALYLLRMRPSNFPTVRLAQLAALIQQSEHLFSKIKEAVSLKEVKDLLDVTANDYWHYHYTFNHPASYKIKKTGTQMINSIIINTIVPVLFAYGYKNNENSYKEKALLWLTQTAAESNVITKGFDAIGITSKQAFDTQALLQLKNEYCNNKRCLECAVGNKLLKSQ